MLSRIIRFCIHKFFVQRNISSLEKLRNAFELVVCGFKLRRVRTYEKHIFFVFAVRNRSSILFL